MIDLFLATLSALIQVVAAYALTDLMTGIYHFATDKGFNFRQQVRLFQNHHDTNTMDAFDWQPMLAAVPGMMLGLWLESPFILAMGAFGCLSQVPHYYAHVRSTDPTIHAVIRWMQKHRLIISPQEHAAHHREPFDRDFCIFSGWNNWWTNKIIATFEEPDYGPGMVVFPVWSIVGGIVFLSMAAGSVLVVVGVIIYFASMR
jgi:hypothetical protein